MNDPHSVTIDSNPPPALELVPKSWEMKKRYAIVTSVSLVAVGLFLVGLILFIMIVNNFNILYWME